MKHDVAWKEYGNLVETRTNPFLKKDRAGLYNLKGSNI